MVNGFCAIHSLILWLIQSKCGRIFLIERNKTIFPKIIVSIRWLYVYDQNFSVNLLPPDLEYTCIAISTDFSFLNVFTSR